MPSLSLLRKSSNYSYNNGRQRKKDSDLLMEATWDEDIQSTVGYFYDYYHDDESLIYKNLHPELSTTKCPIDIKFIEVTYNSENKDIVGYHIQFKPSFDWHNESKISYYSNVFEKKYQAEFPIGMYVDIWDDNSKIYRKWLVTEEGYNLGTQFPTYYILPCDHLFQWIYDGKKYQMCGVSRSQSS